MYQPHRISMMHEWSTGKLLARVVFMQYDVKGHSAVKHYASLYGLALYRRYVQYVSVFPQGCRSPLVVKFADTQKEKEMKKVQQMNTNLFGAAGLSSLGALGPQYLAVSTIYINIYCSKIPCMNCISLKPTPRFSENPIICTGGLMCPLKYCRLSLKTLYIPHSLLGGPDPLYKKKTQWYFDLRVEVWRFSVRWCLVTLLLPFQISWSAPVCSSA